MRDVTTSKAVSHWLGASLESALHYILPAILRTTTHELIIQIGIRPIDQKVAYRSYHNLALQRQLSCRNMCNILT